MRDVKFLEQRIEIAFAELLVRLDDLQHRADVVLHRQPAEDRRLLRQIADAEPGALVHRQVRDVEAVDLDRAGIGADQPGDHVEDGGLAGAVRAEQPDRLAAAKRQRHVVDHEPSLEGAPQAARDEPVLAGMRLGSRLEVSATLGGASSAGAAAPASPSGSGG